MSATIPDEAIKAAKEVFYRYGYSNFAEAEHAFAEAQTRAALEAALPHMLRSARRAWDEAHFDALGCDGSCCDFMHDAPRKAMNPYRSHP